ncbi:MAG TPA: isochorismatase family cysteine hydrolase [Steroidobacter sp.]|jgi:nicotinamidase-related amidase|nr:isochorismatase family cysteine hydrolase [Steroidobacteraceae bacterium]HLS81945.1 isochorismatase family cysteine hydrolase [Steroidobacter sp.]
MPRTATLHGSAPDEHPYALLILDLISDFRFENGPRLVKTALPAARRIARLKARARIAGAPSIYINDNHGRWRSDRAQLIAHCLNDQTPGRPVVELLEPQPDDYFIFKPKHSGFFATPLHALLRHLGSQKLIITGVTIEQCVLFTAMDAYLRDFELFVPRDCVAGLMQQRYALAHLAKVLKADTTPSERLRLRRGGRARQGA